MFINYLKIAVRNLVKLKGFTALNILGLAIGIAASLLIIQYLRAELLVDKHHANLENIYRIKTTFNLGENESETATSPSPLAWTLVNDFPEVKQACRLIKAPSVSQYLIKFEDKSFFEPRGYYVDSTFFDLFTFQFIEGSPRSAIKSPNEVVISDRIANKLFDGSDALGKSVEISSQWGVDLYKITGVFKLDRYPSHLDGEIYINLRSGAIGRTFYDLKEWAGNNLYLTYIELNQNASADGLEAKFPDLVESTAGDKLRTLGFSKSHHLEPLKDIYLKSDVAFQIGPKGNESMIYILGIIALFILIIACINFMNLATAKATLRTKEVAVRKVVGASRKILSGQFMTETIVYTLIALICALSIAFLVLPWFNHLAGKSIRLDILNDRHLLLWMGGILVITSLLAGSYPSLYLSSFSPVNIMRGGSGKGLTAKNIRKVLVITQFIISVGLIQGILVIQNQLEFVGSKSLGFNQEEKIVIPLNTPESARKYQILKNEMLNDPEILAVGGSSTIPGEMSPMDGLYYGEGQNPNHNVHANVNWVDPDYLSLMGFNLQEGRLFSVDRLADTVRSVIITKGMIADLGYTMENAVGRNLYSTWDGITRNYAIIGVIDEFHDRSLYDEVGENIFFWDSNADPGYIVASISTNEINELVSKMESKWKAHVQADPFEFYFLDDRLQKAYETDQRVGGLIFTFTLLAIFISCLGLFGLAAFAAETRRREIGVRKVLGASVSGIVSLLSKEYLILVIVAIVIATPLTWHLMNKWLQNFHYHIDLSWITFFVAGIVALSIAVCTVGFQGIRAATSHPVNAIKSE